MNKYAGKRQGAELHQLRHTAKLECLPRATKLKRKKRTAQAVGYMKVLEKENHEPQGKQSIRLQASLKYCMYSSLTSSTRNS